MTEFDKAAANCSKNISFSKDIVNNLPDLSLGTDEADIDSILVGNDVTANKSLEYSHCSINNSSQMIEDKNRKRKPSRISFKYVGSLFNRLVLKVSSVSSDASDLRKYEILSPEYFELGQMIEQMLNQKIISPNQMPGVIGLLNQGNTCYMNAILQCLSNTDQLTAYFLSDHYRTCLKHNHGVRNCGRFSNISTFAHSTTTLNSGLEYVCGQELGKKSFSRSRGIVTEHLAFLLRSMWSGRSCNEPLSRFKNLVGRMGKQFKGSTQQDAHEFLLWLLDQLHEDLSINFDAAKKKSSKSRSCVRGNTSLEDNSTAGSTSIFQSSQSAINDLFQAHYRSSLTCLKCGHRSHTFDPFLTISLSILSSSSLSLGLKHPIYVVVVYLSATPKQVKIGLQMKHGCTIKDLRDTISNDTNIPRDQLVIADVRLDGHVTTLFENQPIENFRNLSSIYAIEIPRINQVENHVIMVIVNKFENGAQYEKFGDPVVLLMHDSSSFFDMQQDLFLEIKQHILVGLNNYFFSKSFLDLRLINFDNRSDCYYMSSDLFPLRSSAVSRALGRCTSGPRHILVVAEWYQMTRNDFSQSMNDSCVEHESVNVVRSAQCSPSCSLEDCFHVYTQKEQLGADNAWYCPSCNKKQVETLKTLTLWSLPKILVVHLKRFKHDSSQRTKLDTFITFPTRDLDLSDYLSKNIPQATISANKQNTHPSPAYDNKVELGAKKSDSSHDSDVICPQNLQSFSKVTNLSKLKHNETNSTEHSLDCLPIIMKNVNNERNPLSIVVNDLNSSNRSLSNASSQNEFRIKSMCAPSAVNFQTCRESHNASQVSLKDLQSNNNCDSCKNELYDLYAVCNHYGNLHDGHYTAYCKSPLSNTWYLFNDTHVSPIREEEVVTKHAYLLFYKKKTVLSPCKSTCASVSNRGTLHEPNARNDEDAERVKCLHQTLPKTFARSTKIQSSLLSKIRTSMVKRVTSTSQTQTNAEKDTSMNHGHTDDSVRNIQLSQSENKHAQKSTRRNKVFQSTRRLLECTGSCVLSSNESVVCHDIQLSQLHSLQESRV